MPNCCRIWVISWDNKHISNDSEPNPKLTKRLSPDKFFSWFTFVKFSVMYFYLLFRCKKMIAFHSCPRDILVTSKRILREKKSEFTDAFFGTGQIYVCFIRWSNFELENRAGQITYLQLFMRLSEIFIRLPIWNRQFVLMIYILIRKWQDWSNTSILRSLRSSRIA